MAESIEDKFKKDLFEKYAKNKKYLIPKEEYYKLIEDIKTASQNNTTKNRQYYYLLAKYEILQCGDVEKLIKKRKSPEEAPCYFITIEDTFDIVKRAHIATGHGGRDRMLKELSPKYANITSWTVERFKSYCLECQRKKKRTVATGVAVRPIVTEEFNSRGQVDLIDMQSMPSNTFKWIMVYQDHLTKFCILRALTSKRAAEVAYQLADIFLTLGAPAILQSDNGSEFTAHVIQELSTLWTDLKLVHGKPRHPQSQGSVERANGDIKDMLTAWLHDNNTVDWSMGIRFVQFSKNSAYHCEIKRSPYEAMFGTRAKVGLTSSSLPKEVIDRLQSEDDLKAAVTPLPVEDPDPSQVSTPIASELTNNSTAAVTFDEPALEVTTDRAADLFQGHSTEPAISASPANSTELDPISPPLLTPATAAPVELNDEVPVLSPAPTLVQLRQRMIEDHRSAARSAQSSQAERMVKRRRIELPAAQPGDNVAVSIPQVDRGRGDPRNILGVVIDHNAEMDHYKIAVKAGVLNGYYYRNQFDLCPRNLLTTDDISQENLVSLRQAVSQQSKCGGQGFKKCNCSSKQCRSNRCVCFKAKIKCNSRCHSSLNCQNK